MQWMTTLSLSVSMCSLLSAVRCCLRLWARWTSNCWFLPHPPPVPSLHMLGLDKPLFTIGLKDLWLYPHLVWPVRRNRCPECGRGRMLTTTWSHRWQLGARWGPKVGNCPKKDTTVRLTKVTTPPWHPNTPTEYRGDQPHRIQRRPTTLISESSDLTYTKKIKGFTNRSLNNDDETSMLLDDL